SSQLVGEFSLRIDDQHTELRMSRVCAQHRFGQSGFARTGLAEHSKMVRLASSTRPTPKVFEPHRVEHIVSVCVSEVNNFLLVDRKQAVQQRLINSKYSRTRGWDHAEHFWLITIASLAKRRADDEFGDSCVLAVRDGRYLARPLHEIAEHGVFMPTVSQFDA